MLPKPEKIKKKVKSEDSESVKEISPEEKIRHKRRLVIWILTLTIGFSFSFWAFNFFKNFSPPKINFSLPKIETNDKKNIDLDQELKPILSSNQNTWSFYVKSDSFLWEKNASNISSFDFDFKDSNLSSSSLVSELLPSGVDVKEKEITKDNSLEVQSLITVPGKKITLIIKVSGNNLENSKKLIPRLSEKIYWSVVGL